MNQLKDIIGIEKSLEQVCQAIHLTVLERHPQVVGAMHITCADEAEFEAVATFQKCFVKYVLPSLKFAQQSAFRIANLGGRYEWGAVRIADDHYAGSDRSAKRRLLVVKVNAHVGVIEHPGGSTYGRMERYGSESPCCGALNALLAGDTRPFAIDLTEVFVSEGPDRISVLLHDNHIDQRFRLLYAAIVSARLQARKIILDIQDYKQRSSEFLVIPCVTINRPGRDTEIVCGYYMAASEQSDREPEYFGLGDDPSAFEHKFRNRRLVISDQAPGTLREARDHRQLALAKWHELASDRGITLDDQRIQLARKDAANHTGPRHERAKLLLRALITVLAEVDPVSAAILLFAHGSVGIHHAFHVHRLARQLEDSNEAKKVLDEIRSKIDTLSPEQAEAMLEVLSRQYQT